MTKKVTDMSCDSEIIVSDDLVKQEEIDELNDHMDSICSKNEGIREGTKEEKMQIAKDMFKNGVSIDEIIKYTGLSDAELEKVEKEVLGIVF
ncbi:MAG: hypothetical protein HFH47_03805 [Bacilli bacterium]|nr:hypothetical protein [Bacilli bacterium]